MPKYFGALTIVLMLGMVLTRVMIMRRRGIQAMNFGKIDKTDFLIPPFALFYFYTVFAHAFNLPVVSTQEFFQSDVIAWAGVFLCLAGLLLLFWSLFPFVKICALGLVLNIPINCLRGEFFVFSTNPITVHFYSFLLGSYLFFLTWTL